MNVPIKKYSEPCSLVRAASISLVLLLGQQSGMAYAQTPGSPAQASTAGASFGSSGSRTRFGAFAGFTDRRNAEFSFGMQMEHALDRNWSAGATVEHTPDEWRGNDATFVFGLMNFRPDSMPRLKLTGGAGIEFNEIFDDAVMFRTGVGYDLFLEGPLSLTPMLAFNFGEGNNSMTLGANLNFNF